MSNLIRLPDIFPPHIANRGRSYFEQGQVQGIRETASGHYQATVRGSAKYSVWLQLDEKLHIQNGGCNCPYDDTCKHMAALWFALQTQTRTPNKQQLLADALAQLDKAALYKLLLQLAKIDAVQERLIAMLQPEKREELYQQQIKQMFTGIGYDYHDALNLGRRLQDWLADVEHEGEEAIVQALPHLMPRLIKAYEMMDDSNGDLGEAMYRAIGLLNQAADENAPHSLIRCLDKCLKNERYFYCGDYGRDIYQIRARIWCQRGEWQAWQKYVDDRLAAADNWDTEFWAMTRWHIFQAKGDTAGAQNWFDQHLHLANFRKIAVTQAVEEQDWAKAEQLLRDGIALAEEQSLYGLVYDWQKQLFDILQQTGGDIRDVAANLAFSGSLSLPYYLAWKATFSAAEWPSALERELTRQAKYPQLYAEILLQERQFDRLLPILQDRADVAMLDHFSPAFPEPYHAQIVDCYLAAVDTGIRIANSRTQYQQLAKQLDALRRRYPKHQQTVVAFAAEIKTRYTRRPALLAEWAAAGL